MDPLTTNNAIYRDSLILKQISEVFVLCRSKEYLFVWSLFLVEFHAFNMIL